MVGEFPPVVISPIDVPREKIKNIFVGNDGLSNLFLVESESFKSNQIVRILTLSVIIIVNDNRFIIF